MAKVINWKHIKSEYEETLKSVRSIARENDIAHATIQKKAKKEEWIKLDENLIGDKDLITTSSFLGKTAIRKIKELISELGADYSSVDEPLIIMFASNYEMWIDLQIKLKETGITCTSPKGGSYLSAEFNALKSVEKTLTNIANSFGLSLSSRKRLGINSNNNQNNNSSIFDLANAVNDIEVDI